jgi:thioredoxin-dependent peroxiredoxin
MVCTKQFCSYRDRADEFAGLNATVVGISSQDLESHEGFAGKHSLNVPLLADVDKQVARAYSAYSSRLGTKRAVIVIDEDGIVRHRHDHLLGLDYQSVDDLKAALDTLPSPAKATGERRETTPGVGLGHNGSEGVLVGRAVCGVVGVVWGRVVVCS